MAKKFESYDVEKMSNLTGVEYVEVTDTVTIGQLALVGTKLSKEGDVAMYALVGTNSDNKQVAAKTGDNKPVPRAMAKVNDQGDLLRVSYLRLLAAAAGTTVTFSTDKKKYTLGQEIVIKELPVWNRDEQRFTGKCHAEKA